MFQEDKIVENDRVISLEYILRYEDGEVIADSKEDGNLEFIQGHGHVFSVLEGAIEHMRIGQELELSMLPADTYGEYDEEAVEVIPLTAFPDNVEITEGLEIELYDEDSGAEFEAIVVAVADDGVTVDMNHPLAGEPLSMWLRVADIREATAGELAHDHVHDDEHAQDNNHDQDRDGQAS